MTNPNILWGAAAATLGATLAEWQRRREEEEAARRAAMQNSSSDSDEISADVLARRRARVIAKNETKREQERRWEAARVAENQKNDEAIEAAWNQSRRAHSLESMSATIASQTAKSMSGTKPLLKPIKQEENPFAGLSAGGGVGSKTVGETLLTNAEILGLNYSPEMLTYMIASINVQSKGSNTTQDGDNAHVGPAQLSRNELDTPYGEGFDCKDGVCRGYGLGLPGRDLYDNDTAVLGMDSRIQQVLEKADNLGEKNDVSLTSTDEYIIVAMAQNGPGFDLDDINRVMNPDNGFIKDGEIDWEAYFDNKQISYNDRLDLASWLNPNDWQFLINNTRTGGADYDTKFILEEFYNETSQLEDKGYALPDDLETERVEELINRPLTGIEGGQ